ncbi:MAG: hypothetical protein KAT46_04530 [Deltaproteobacteria bacterium]|nr:hypothetical protein [Deltaproteobacteria bacterium]
MKIMKKIPHTRNITLLILAAFILLAPLGCASKKNLLRKSFQETNTIGLVKAEYLPTVGFKPFATNTLVGAIKGAGKGAFEGLSSGLAILGGEEDCTSSIGTAGVCLIGISFIVTTTTTLGAIAGTVSGPMKSMSKKEGKEIDRSLKAALGHLKAQESLISKFRALTLEDEKKYLILKDIGPKNIKDTPCYVKSSETGKKKKTKCRQLPADLNLDAVLELSITEIGFDAIKDDDPLISVKIEGHARFIRLSDGKVLLNKKISHLGERIRLSTMTENKGSLLGQEITKAYSVIAEEAYNFFSTNED